MSPTVEHFLERLRGGEPVTFSDTMDVVAAHYEYIPVRFENGQGEDLLVNEPGMNEGSCKVFSFASLNDLGESETLALFGEYYRRDVLGNPDGVDHRNIRNFMKYGWGGIRFDAKALLRR